MTQTGDSKHERKHIDVGEGAEEVRLNFKKKDSLVLPQRQAHVLLHLLQAVVVRVDEVKGQRSRQGTAPPPRRDPQQPAGEGQRC